LSLSSPAPAVSAARAVVSASASLHRISASAICGRAASMSVRSTARSGAGHLAEYDVISGRRRAFALSQRLDLPGIEAPEKFEPGAVDAPKVADLARRVSLRYSALKAN
jgi:hypothetical protein